MSSQLREVASWRLATELVRRHPDLKIIETHPGGGQYDCLSIGRVEDGSWTTIVDLNRHGSAHFLRSGHEPWREIWADMISTDDPRDLLMDLERRAHLRAPTTMPSSTPRTLSYRVITGLLCQTVFARTSWRCVNGFLDTSGDSTSRRNFAAFPDAQRRLDTQLPDDITSETAYRFWLLGPDDGGEDRVLCFEETGLAWTTSGQAIDLMRLYTDGGRSLDRVVGHVLLQLSG